MYKRYKYFDDGNIHVDLEEIDGCLFAHIAFTKFSKSILSKAKQIWWELRCRAYFDGYEEIFSYTKDARMADMIGGGYTEVGEDSQELINSGYRMFKWELIQSPSPSLA